MARTYLSWVACLSFAWSGCGGGQSGAEGIKPVTFADPSCRGGGSIAFESLEPSANGLAPTDVLARLQRRLATQTIPVVWKAQPSEVATLHFSDFRHADTAGYNDGVRHTEHLPPGSHPSPFPCKSSIGFLVEFRVVSSDGRLDAHFITHVSSTGGSDVIRVDGHRATKPGRDLKLEYDEFAYPWLTLSVAETTTPGELDVETGPGQDVSEMVFARIGFSGYGGPLVREFGAVTPECQPEDIEPSARDASQLAAALTGGWVACRDRSGEEPGFAGLVITHSGNWQQWGGFDGWISLHGFGREGSLSLRGNSDDPALTHAVDLLGWMDTGMVRANVGFSASANTLRIRYEHHDKTVDVTLTNTNLAGMPELITWRARGERAGKPACGEYETHLQREFGSRSELEHRLVGRWAFCGDEAAAHWGIEFGAQGDYVYLNAMQQPIEETRDRFEVVEEQLADARVAYRIELASGADTTRYAWPAFSDKPIKLRLLGESSVSPVTLSALP